MPETKAQEPPEQRTVQESPPELKEAQPVQPASSRATTEKPVDEPVSSEPFYHLFVSNSKSMAQLARGSSVVIASLLTIPDAVALIPNATSTVGWLLQIIGVWISAAVLWFVGFLAILHACNLLVKGVELNEKGIKIWRRARLIPWSELESVAVEPQQFFTRLFALPVLARKLTLFESHYATLHKEALGKDGQGKDAKTSSRWGKLGKFAEERIVPHYIPSFLFAPEDFERLCNTLCQRRFGITPNVPELVALEPLSMARMKKMYRFLDWQRVFLTLLIAFGLVTLLGRKAAQNYSYNLGNREMAHGNFERAARRYRESVSVEPTFAAGWNYLGNAEFRMGDYVHAKQYWHRALLLKPDFVEAKVSLAYLSLRLRQFNKTKEYLNAALALAPMNPTALVTRADYELRIGRTREAINDARLVLSQPNAKATSAGYTATCVMAQGKVRLNEPQEALKLLETLGPLDDASDRLGANLTYRLQVTAEAKLALGDTKSARELIETALKRAPNSRDLMLVLVDTALAEHDFQEARKQIDKLFALGLKDPWIEIANARLSIEEQNPQAAIASLARASQNPDQDSRSLLQAACLYLHLNDRDSCIQLVKRSLAMNPSDPEARELYASAANNQEQPQAKTSVR